MDINDFLEQTNVDRTKMSPAKGKMLDVDNKAFDVTKFIKTIFNAVTGKIKVEDSDILNKMPTLEDGNVPVAIQDQHTEIVDLYAHKHLEDFTLESNRAIDDVTFNIDSLVRIPVVGDLICLNETLAFYQGTILVVVDNGGDNYTITVDTPLDFAYTTAAICSLGTHNLAVDGSITNQIFKISPKNIQDGVSWDITGFTFVMCGLGVGVSNNAPDDGDFGVTEALTNGVVIRSVDGTTKNIFNVKQNGEMKVRGMNIVYTDISKSDLYSVAGSKKFSGFENNGVTVRLNSTTNDEIQAIIQDDLTDMTDFCIVVHGHVVKNN